MKVKKKQKAKFILELTEKEATLLYALADFPDWGEQPEDTGEFLQGLYEALHAAGVKSIATVRVFCDHTSI